MKKVFLFLLLGALMPVQMRAQTNPKPGFIITNHGDTIRGNIDFRTNERMAKLCEFWANGANEGKTYKPGDIEAFRFDDGGKFFVTRRLNVTGEPELYFAEFMVQGMMNLYCIAYDSKEYFFFEREDGEMALLTNRLSVRDAKDEMENLQEKREQYGKVKLLLKDSWKAVEDMNQQELTRKNLVDIVRDYHHDVCTDGSTCMVYEYKEKSDKPVLHIKAFAGYAYYFQEKTENQKLEGENYPGSALEMGLGLELEFKRIVKGLSVELGVAYSPKTKSEHDVMVLGGREPSHTIYEMGRLIGTFGVVKSFGNGKWLPLVRGGGFYVSNFGNRETRYYMSKTMIDVEWDNTSHFGVYLGGGVQTALGKHYARLHADLYKSIGRSDSNMMKLGITAEFAL